MAQCIEAARHTILELTLTRLLGTTKCYVDALFLPRCVMLHSQTSTAYSTSFHLSRNRASHTTHTHSELTVAAATKSKISTREKVHKVLQLLDSDSDAPIFGVQREYKQNVKHAQVIARKPDSAAQNTMGQRIADAFKHHPERRPKCKSQ